MMKDYSKFSDREEEDLYDELIDLTKKICRKILYNKTDIEDVAQNTLFKFYKNRDNIENIYAWIKVVARRETFKKINSNKFISLGERDVIDKSISQEINLDNTEMDSEDNSVSISEAKNLLSKENFKIYQMIIDKNYNISDIAKKLNISHQAANTRIYKTKRNLKAAKLQAVGYLGTKAIIDYQMNKNIIKFINTLKVKLNNNDLKSLRKYFTNYDVNNIETISIVKTFEYEIEKIKNKFNICIPYLSINGKIEFMQVRIFIDIKNRIRVEDIICETPNVIKANKTKEEIFCELPRSKKGLIPVKLSDTNLLKK